MASSSRFFVVVLLLSACEMDPIDRPPDDAATGDVRLFDPPDASRTDGGTPADDAPGLDAATEPTWDVFVLRVLTEPPASASGWDADGTVDPVVTIDVGDDTGTTEVRADVAFVSGWAGAAWLEPVLVTTETELLAGLDVALADDDGASDQAIATCHLALDRATLAGRLASLVCEAGTVGYVGPGSFDVRLGLRPHDDDTAVAGSGPSVWEIRMTNISIHPTDESGASWDPPSGAPDPVLSIAMLDDGPGSDVEIPVTTRFDADTLEEAFTTPVVIARLPDQIRDFPGQRDLNAYWRLFDDDGGTLVPMDTCDFAPTTSAAPAGTSEDGSTFCLFDTIDDAVWTVDYEVVRFGNGWL